MKKSVLMRIPARLFADIDTFMAKLTQTSQALEGLLSNQKNKVGGVSLADFSYGVQESEALEGTHTDPPGGRESSKCQTGNHKTFRKSSWDIGLGEELLGHNESMLHKKPNW